MFEEKDAETWKNFHEVFLPRVPEIFEVVQTDTKNHIPWYRFCESFLANGGRFERKKMYFEGTEEEREFELEENLARIKCIKRAIHVDELCFDETFKTVLNESPLSYLKTVTSNPRFLFGRKLVEFLG